MAVRTVRSVELLRGGCVLCGRGSRALCASCLARTEPPPTTRVREVGPVPALFAYAGHGARAVQALKFRDGRRLVGPLADRMALLVGDGHARTAPLGGRAGPRPVAVTWVPTTAARRRGRGFDQAELLAVALARRLALPVVPTLRRRSGRPVTGLGRDERARAVRFSARAAVASPVLVVDDVCTTGATLRGAVSALRARGTAVAGAIVVARTP